MNLKKLITAFAFAFLAAANVQAAAFEDVFVDQSDERGGDRYEAGTDAIDEERWDEAIRHFTAVVEMKGARADGALYWTAYAMNKRGRRVEALRTLEALRRSHPSSRWIDDAKALEIELGAAGGQNVAPEGVGDEELKIIAINSLMQTDPERAYPLLEKIVRGSGSNRIRERALFVLSQSASPNAQKLLAEIARGNANPDLQRKAIKYLGISGNGRGRQVLNDVYRTTSSPEVKKEILKGLMISGDKASVLAIVSGEQNAALRSEAISTLGIMGARAELASMYATETAPSVRSRIIHALFLSGDSERISDLAMNEKDPALRRDAIKKLGLMGAKTGPALIALYNRDASVRDHVIDALFLQSNARALIDISKRETNPALKREALQKLSLMRNDEAVAYMLEILNQ